MSIEIMDRLRLEDLEDNTRLWATSWVSFPEEGPEAYAVTLTMGTETIGLNKVQADQLRELLDSAINQ